MSKFNIYYAGTHQAEFQEELEFETPAAALDYAKKRAIEDYESNCGGNGYLSWEECREELIHSGEEKITDEDVDNYYKEVVYSTIQYYVEKI